jgi:hypothetical protein
MSTSQSPSTFKSGISSSLSFSALETGDEGRPIFEACCWSASVYQPKLTFLVLVFESLNTMERVQNVPPILKALAVFHVLAKSTHRRATSRDQIHLFASAAEDSAVQMRLLAPPSEKSVMSRSHQDQWVQHTLFGGIGGGGGGGFRASFLVSSECR